MNACTILHVYDVVGHPCFNTAHAGIEDDPTKLGLTEFDDNATISRPCTGRMHCLKSKGHLRLLPMLFAALFGDKESTEVINIH